MGSCGIDRKTGRLIRDWDHVVQSVQRILATRIGFRIMRRSFGSGALTILGRRLTPQVVALFRLLVVLSLERWEPRVKVRRVTLTGTVDAARGGDVGAVIAVDYLPNGHRGDTTVAGPRDINL